MRSARLGCLVVGLLWAGLVVFTFFGAALGHPVEPNGVRWFDYALIVELLLLPLIAWFFYRRAMKGDDS